RHGRQKDWYDPVLSERNTEIGVSGHLESESPVSALVYKFFFRQTANRRAAQYERPRCKADVLVPVLAVLANERDALCLLKFSTSDHQVRMSAAQNIACHLHRTKSPG